MAGETKTIEFLPCDYRAQRKVKNCTARATMIARASDSIGRPLNQYELCAPHTEQIAEREGAQGRVIVTRRVDGKT